MYLGYSHCPDVCRPTLAVLAEISRRLRQVPGRSHPDELVFVTLDPARDTPEALRAHLATAGAHVVGLRGSEAQIAALAHQPGILFSLGPGDDAGRYLVEHPATILLIDPAATLRAGFALPHDPERIVELILEIQRELAAGRAD